MKEQRQSAGIKGDKSGQITVEMVLITALLTASCYLVLETFKEPEKNPIYQFVAGPWKVVAGMMESGVWEKRNPGACGDACRKHPNRTDKMFVAEGKSLSPQ